MSNKFVAVKKFVKSSIKKLKCIEKYYNKNEGSNFWILEINTKDSHDRSQSNEKILIGCVGFKRTRTSLEISSTDSVEEKLKSSKTFNVENIFQDFSDPRAGVKDRGEISHLCVDSLYRRNGIGKFLMSIVNNWAKECSSNMVTDNKLNECEIQNMMEKISEDTIRIDGKGGIPYNSKGIELEGKHSTILLNTIDLTVLTELMPAIGLYEQLGFKVEDPPVDLGGGCYLQHMSMRI